MRASEYQRAAAEVGTPRERLARIREIAAIITPVEQRWDHTPNWENASANVTVAGRSFRCISRRMMLAKCGQGVGSVLRLSMLLFAPDLRRLPKNVLEHLVKSHGLPKGTAVEMALALWEHCHVSAEEQDKLFSSIADLVFGGRTGVSWYRVPPSSVEADFERLLRSGHADAFECVKEISEEDLKVIR